MKQVIIRAYPHVAIQGDMLLPDDYDDDEIVEYIRTHAQDVDFSWTPVEYDFEDTDFVVDEIDGETVEMWETFD